MSGESKREPVFWMALVSFVLLGSALFLFRNVEIPKSIPSEPKVSPPTLSERGAQEVGPTFPNPEEQVRPEAPESEDAHDALAESLRQLSEHPGVVPGELLLRFRSPSDIASLRSRASSLGVRVLWSDARLNSARIAYSDPDILADELHSNREVYENAGPNYLMRIPGLPEEPVPETDSENAGGTAPFEETLLASIGADRDRSRWGEGVTVAILDSGISEHPALENVEITRIDLVESDDIHGHGTAMASLVAGRIFPAEGIAPAADLIDVRVTDQNGVSSTGLLAEAILSAADRGADVVNVSLGTVGHSAVLQTAIEYANERGVVVVAAAGNEQTTQLAYPAAYEGVISVGAVDAANTQAYFSNSGEALTISAPGVGIVSAYGDEQLILGSGTSQATAITSGVVVALLSRGHRASEIVEILETNAFRTGAPREQVGAGVIRVP